MGKNIKKHDALKLELINFVESIKGNEKPIVDGQTGRNALAMALNIQKMIQKELF